MQYINFNGNIYPEHETVLPVTNRAFRYGDGFFETMVMFNKKIPLLEYHWSRMEFTCEVISASLPGRFDIEKFYNMVLDLSSVNEAVVNARVRLQFYRKGGGLYLPEEDGLGYVISMEKLENTQFEPGAGLKLGIREDCYKPVSMVSDLKNSSALMYVLTSQFAKKEGWDEMFLTNQYEQLSEAIHSNVFLVIGDKLITPDIDSGCTNGVMRNYLLHTLGDSIVERPVEVKELKDASEIILSNAVRGVQWVKEYDGKKYGSTKAEGLAAMLNRTLLGIEQS